MCTTRPIKLYGDVRKLKNYFLEKEEYRNYLLVTVGLNTALRICDILALKWSDVTEPDKSIKEHIDIKETKTGKTTSIMINSSVEAALKLCLKKACIKSEFLFANRKGEPISRIYAFKLIKQAGRAVGLPYEISPHSLRKTFGYHAAQNGTPPAVLMQIYNHSSYEITKRYLGITQDEKDKVFMEVTL
ncbi:MAG: tyrosine-type recombinase/integrase [Firmicutes bacterium]|nr:tyrosine-type recombinase/integrase [Bacillota bacterium]